MSTGGDFARIRVRMHRRDADPDGVIQGGVLEGHIDVGAALVARFYTNANVADGAAIQWVTLILKVLFVRPVYVGDKLVVTGRVVKSGRKSLTVLVRAAAIRRATGKEEEVATAIAVMVATKEGSSVPHGVPAVEQQDGGTEIKAITVGTPLTGPMAFEHEAVSLLMFPPDRNPHRSIFGGRIATLVDEAAHDLIDEICGRAAMDRSSLRFVTHLAEVHFNQPIFLGDLVKVFTKAVSISEHAVVIEVRIAVVRESGTELVDVGTGNVVLVSVNKDRKEVPHGLYSD